MGITYGDHLIDTGYHDITPEQEREIEAREECARRGLDPDEICADGGVAAWMVVDHERYLVQTVVCPHDCYRPGDCDGSCTHPDPHSDKWEGRGCRFSRSHRRRIRAHVSS